MSTQHHFLIEPLKRVGPIFFGMHKDKVGRAFTYVYTSFFKGTRKKVRSDDCEVVGLTIHYDDESHVNYIEVYKAKYASVILELFGRDITGLSVKDFVTLLKCQGAKPKRTEFGYDFPELGISTYNHIFQSEDEPVETIGFSPIGRKD